MVILVGASACVGSGMFGRSFDNWRQEGNEWWRLGSLADRKDSIGLETLENDYFYNHSCEPRDPQNTRRTPCRSTNRTL